MLDFRFRTSLIVEFWHRLPDKICNKSFFLWFDIFLSDKKKDTFHFLMEVNKKCEWMWKMYVRYMLLGFTIVTIITSTTSVCVCLIFNGEFDTKYVYYPFKAV